MGRKRTQTMTPWGTSSSAMAVKTLKTMRRGATVNKENGHLWPWNQVVILAVQKMSVTNRPDRFVWSIRDFASALVCLMGSLRLDQLDS
jgi:hypothetical protein